VPSSTITESFIYLERVGLDGKGETGNDEQYLISMACKVSKSVRGEYHRLVAS
jgi:hypothetical protein